MVALEGLVNRRSPKIFIYSNSNDSQWFQMTGLTGTKQDFSYFASTYASYAKGSILYPAPSPAPSAGDISSAEMDVAAAISGVYDTVPVTADLEQNIPQYPVVANVSQCFSGSLKTSDDVYSQEIKTLWQQNQVASSRIVLSLNPGDLPGARDYATALGAPIVWTDPASQSGQNVVSLIMGGGSSGKSLAADSPWYGWWPSETSGIADASSYGVYTVTAQDFHNPTFWSGLRPTIETTQSPGPTPSPSATYPPMIISMMVSSGDNITMDQNLLYTDYKSWTQYNATTPLSWSVSPELYYVGPYILSKWQALQNKYTNSYLIGGASGAGYMWPEPTATFMSFPAESPADLLKYTKDAGKLLAKSGMSVTFILNHDQGEPTSPPSMPSPGSTLRPDAGADYASAGVQGIFDNTPPESSNYTLTYPLPNPTTSPMVIVTQPYEQSGGSGGPSCQPGTNCDWQGYEHYLAEQLPYCSSKNPCFLSLSFGPDGGNNIGMVANAVVANAPPGVWFVRADTFFTLYCKFHNYPCWGNGASGHRSW